MTIKRMFSIRKTLRKKAKKGHKQIQIRSNAYYTHFYYSLLNLIKREEIKR